MTSSQCLFSVSFTCSFILLRTLWNKLVLMRILQRKSKFPSTSARRWLEISREYGFSFDSPPPCSDGDQLTCQNITLRVWVCLCFCESFGLHFEDMATKMELAPLRPWDDFFPGADRFAKPEFGDLAKWNNRVISNLLYYQTNYFAVVLVVFLIVG